MHLFSHTTLAKLLKSRPILQKDAFTDTVVWWGGSLCCGGVEKQISETAKILSSHGVSLHLLVSDLQPQRGNDFFLENASAHFTSISPAASSTFFSQKYVNALTGVLAALGPMPKYMGLNFLYTGLGLLHYRPRVLQVWNADFSEIALAAAIVGVPEIIVAARSMSPDMRYPVGYESVNDALAHGMYSALIKSRKLHFTANSRAGCVAYEKWLGLEPGSVVYTPNAFAPVEKTNDFLEQARLLRSELGIPETAQVLGGLIRFVSIKDPGLWVSAALKVLQNRPETYAVLGGDGPLRAEVMNIVNQLGASDRMLLPGTISQADAFWEMVDVAMLTSHIEGMPNVLIEAQRHGKPAVTTNAGGAGDIVLHNETGYVLTERNPLLLAKHVESILKNPGWARAAGERAKQHIEDNFTGSSAVSNLLALYEKLNVTHG